MVARKIEDSKQRTDSKLILILLHRVFQGATTRNRIHFCQKEIVCERNSSVPANLIENECQSSKKLPVEYGLHGVPFCHPYLFTPDSFTLYHSTPLSFHPDVIYLIMTEYACNVDC